MWARRGGGAGLWTISERECTMRLQELSLWQDRGQDVAPGVKEIAPHRCAWLAIISASIRVLPRQCRHDSTMSRLAGGSGANNDWGQASSVRLRLRPRCNLSGFNLSVPTFLQSGLVNQGMLWTGVCPANQYLLPHGLESKLRITKRPWNKALNPP